MILIKNGTIITPQEVFQGDILIDEDKIKQVSKEPIKTVTGVKEIDATGKVVLPGLICAHHHLYSTFARGMNLGGEPAKNFPETLEKLWWRLDKALQPEDLYWSSIPPLVDAVRMGVTTIIDHHESQGYQKGSLDEIAKAVKKVGLRASLCLGVSDRYDKGIEGIKECERFLKKFKKSPNNKLHTMVGLHASFTVNDITLNNAVALAKENGVGIHVHCAEDISDQEETVQKHGKRVIKRLHDAGALGEKSIAVHCIHLDEEEMELLKTSNTNVVHNSESNMNNAVGWSNVIEMNKRGILVGLGSDGMSSNMWREMRVAYLISHHATKDPRVGFMEAINFLFKNNPIIAKRIFGQELGIIREGAVADLIVMDYLPPTPLNQNTVLGHILFGLLDAHVETTIAGGDLLYHKGKFKKLDIEEIKQKSQEKAVKLWQRI